MMQTEDVLFTSFLAVPFLLMCCIVCFYVGRLLIYCIVCVCVGTDREEEENAAARAQQVAAVARMSAAAVPARTLAAALAVKPKLGYFPYSTAVERSCTAASGERLVCAICLEAFVRGATCSEVPGCRHMFHRDCIDLWMRSKSTCPLCRATIVPGSEPLSAAEDMV